MKYVLIADLHCGLKDYSMLVDGIPEHLYFPLLNLRNAAKLAKKEKAILIVAGDIMHSKTLLHQQVLTEVYETIKEVSNEVESYWLLGNHDFHIINSKVYSYLMGYNIELATPNDPIRKHDFALVSYSDKETLIETIKNLEFEGLKLIVSHFGIEEADLSSSSNYKTGEFSVKDFSSMKDMWIMLGHYHKPQKLTDRMYYIGSPTITRLSEIGEEKRILLLDTDTNKLESIPTIYPKVSKLVFGKSDKLDIDHIEESVKNEYTKFILNIPKDYNFMKDAVSLNSKYRGYINLSFIDEDVNNKESSDIIDIDKIDMNTILSDYQSFKKLEDNIKDKAITKFHQLIKEE